MSIKKRQKLIKEQPKQLKEVTAEIAPAATVSMERKVIITNALSQTVIIYYLTTEGARTLHIQIGGKQPEGSETMGMFPINAQAVIITKSNIIF